MASLQLLAGFCRELDGLPSPAGQDTLGASRLAVSEGNIRAGGPPASFSNCSCVPLRVVGAVLVAWVGFLWLCLCLLRLVCVFCFVVLCFFFVGVVCVVVLFVVYVLCLWCVRRGLFSWVAGLCGLLAWLACLISLSLA